MAKKKKVVPKVPKDDAFDEAKKSLAARLASSQGPTLTGTSAKSSDAGKGSLTQTVTAVETGGCPPPSTPPMTTLADLSASPASQQWTMAAKNMGSDPGLYIHHAELQTTRAAVLHQMDQAKAAKQLSESKLGIETERNVWLGKQLEEAEKILNQNQTERERCAAQLLQWEGICKELSQENEQLKHKLDLSEQARKQKQVTEEHTLVLDNSSLTNHTAELQAELAEARREINILREVNERGGKQLWDADTRVDALNREKELLQRELAKETEVHMQLQRDLETSHDEKQKLVFERDNMEMSLRPLEEANAEVSSPTHPDNTSFLVGLF